MKPYAEIAVAFASALVNRDWQGAHDLLAPRLKAELVPEVLRDQFASMFRGYTEGEPTSVHHDEQICHG